jgi:hypothetical protein
MATPGPKGASSSRTARLETKSRRGKLFRALGKSPASRDSLPHHSTISRITGQSPVSRGTRPHHSTVSRITGKPPAPRESLPRRGKVSRAVGKSHAPRESLLRHGKVSRATGKSPAPPESLPRHGKASQQRYSINFAHAVPMLFDWACAMRMRHPCGIWIQGGAGGAGGVRAWFPLRHPRLQAGHRGTAGRSVSSPRGGRG